jgi:hypothetical protein
MMYFQVHDTLNLHADDLGIYSVVYKLCHTNKIDKYYNMFVPRAAQADINRYYEAIINLRTGEISGIQVSNCVEEEL